jgi:hypothetical protein
MAGEPATVRGAYPMRAEDRARTPQELVEAARLDNERLGPLAAERAKAFEGMTLEQLYARWADVMGRRGEWTSLDDFKVEVMAMYRAIGPEIGKRADALRVGGFDFDEPMQ